MKDQIRRELASEKVAEELKKLVDGIIGPLDADFNKYQRAVLTADADKQPAPAVPASLTDLAPLAEKNGLKAGETGPMSYLEMRNSPLGKSGLVDVNRPLLTVLFGSKEIDVHQPVVTIDIDGNRYIVVKQSDTPGRVPKLDEVRESRSSRRTKPRRRPSWRRSTPRSSPRKPAKPRRRSRNSSPMIRRSKSLAPTRFQN